MPDEIDKYLDMIASMSIDCRMGGITIETYLYNLKTALELMNKLIHSPEPSTQGGQEE